MNEKDSRTDEQQQRQKFRDRNHSDCACAFAHAADVDQDERAVDREHDYNTHDWAAKEWNYQRH